MKVFGLIVLHYGESYLSAAIQSIYAHCAKIVILYTPVPSFGYRTDIKCPETAEDLMIAAFSVDPEHKIVWIEKCFNGQGEQRDYGYYYCKAQGADFILVADADEVYEPSLITEALEYSKANKVCLKVRMRHFWRSFNYICEDDQRQHRIINVPYFFQPWLTWGDKVLINHLGYAQGIAITEYKWRIHGDLSERRHDIDWYKDRFLKFPEVLTDLHPTTEKWAAKPFDKKNLPVFIHSHPFFNLDTIK